MLWFAILTIPAELLWLWRADLQLRRLPGSWLWRPVLACFVLCQAVYLICFLTRSNWLRSSQNAVPLPLHVSAYLWHLIVVPAVWLVIVIAHGVRLLGRHAFIRDSPASGPENGQESPPAPGVSRRQVMGALAVAIPPLVTAGMSGGTFMQLGTFRARCVNVTIPGLPPDLHGLTIAQVTDLHIGKLTRSGMIARVANAANAMAADLIIFSGDLIDYSLKDMPKGIDFIRSLHPRHGPEFLAMVEGNHDLLERHEEFEQMARDAGLPILIDEARTLQVPGRKTPVQLLGLCWGIPGSYDRLHMEDEDMMASLNRVMPLREPGAFPILLTHHPHAFQWAPELGLPLTLAGHTHGGQIMLTDHVGAGPIRFRYWTGLYRRGESQLFVNNGVGNWFPLRINAPAEIVKLTLLRG